MCIGPRTMPAQAPLPDAAIVERGWSFVWCDSRSLDAITAGANVLETGALGAREVLLGRRSESPSDHPDRAGPGRRRMPSHHCARAVGVRAEGQRRVKLDQIGEVHERA
jgi:hypothetical protein